MQKNYNTMQERLTTIIGVLLIAVATMTCMSCLLILVIITDGNTSSPMPVALSTDIPTATLEVAPAVVFTPSSTPTAASLAISRVVDADTFEMSDGSTVRVLGIDAPETGTTCGDRATYYITEYIKSSVIVVLESDPQSNDIDKYGRLLRYVYADGVDLGLLLVENGLADSHKYSSATGYPYSKEEEYFDKQVPMCGESESVPTATPESTVVPTEEFVYYANCSAVRAAGKAPIHRGDPGWSDSFDRDGDGTGCE